MIQTETTSANSHSEGQSGARPQAMGQAAFTAVGGQAASGPKVTGHTIWAGYDRRC
jgi:hypothetical protein